MRNKDISFIRHGTVVIGLKTISATLVRTREENVARAKATVTSLVDAVKTISAKTLNQFHAVAAANAPLVAKVA